MNDYELVAILNPEIQDEDVTETVDRLTQFITSRGGEVQNVDQWGRRRLAYPIGRQMEGTYVVTHLRLQPASAAELEANLRISEDVLRHLLVRYSPAEQAAALAASQRRRPRPMGEEQSDGPAPAAVRASGEAGEAAAAIEESSTAATTEHAETTAEAVTSEAATEPAQPAAKAESHADEEATAATDTEPEAGGEGTESQT